jgi:Flp pilus assembly pilin Flp
MSSLFQRIATPRFTRGNTLRQRGQGMTEYIIIVALIAVAAIGVYALFGKTIRNQVAGLAGEVAGTGGASSVEKAGTAATDASSAADKDKKMNSYTN